MRSVLLLALTACGSSHAPTPTSSDPPAPPPAPVDAAPQPDAAPLPACPASYKKATGACTTYAQWCEYPEGDCSCSYDVPEHCGGARVPPMKPGTPTVWKCTPKPPEFRADGCPGTDPAGRACSTEGKVCTYQGCCFTQVTCKGGQWQGKGAVCPP